MNQNFKLPDDFDIKNPNIIERIKKDFRENNNFHYLFTGVVGSGKTFLAKLIADQLTDDVKIVSARKIYREYLTILGSNVSDKADALNKRVRCMRGTAVILDDLGAEKPKTDGSKAFIEDIIEDRYEWVKAERGKYTVVTTNLTGKEIAERYGVRVLDRMHEIFTIMKFKNFSFRKINVEIIER